MLAASTAGGKVTAADIKLITRRRADGVFFAGTTATGGAALTRAMDKAASGSCRC